MDSLTQFVLGAAVSTACVGSRIGPRKAALLGGLLGTLPDLDVLQPYADQIDSFVFHRGWSHSLVVHALVTPLIGEGLLAVFRSWRPHRWRIWAAVFLCLATHALLDALTVYGTRLFWPLLPDPVGLGSVFIIDPLYTVPLLVITVWALCQGSWSRRFGRGLAVALAISTAYLGWGLVVKEHMQARAARLFADAGIAPDRILAQAGPFNTLLWRVTAVTGEDYYNLYLSVLDDSDRQPIYVHPRHQDLLACLQSNTSLAKLEWFSRGYYLADREGDRIAVSDLRMGLTPAYTFTFAIAEKSGDGWSQIVPERGMGARRMVAEGDWEWLKTRLAGRSKIRPAEAASVLPEAVATPAPTDVKKDQQADARSC